MRNKRIRLVTASALVLALALSSGMWRYDDAALANGSASLAASADPDDGGQEAGHEKKERLAGHGGYRLFTEDGRVAASLGLTADELASALQADKSLAELAKERGVDAAGVQSAVEAALKSKLDEKQAAGKLTQLEYEKQASQLANFAAVLLNSRPGRGAAASGGA